MPCWSQGCQADFGGKGVRKISKVSEAFHSERGLRDWGGADFLPRFASYAMGAKRAHTGGEGIAGPAPTLLQSFCQPNVWREPAQLRIRVLNQCLAV